MAVPPDFTAGQVLTAAQMNAVGLWVTKPLTAFSAASAINVDNAYSADFDNYIIVIKYDTSTTGSMTYRNRVGGVDASSNYNSQFLVVTGTSVSAARSTSQTSASIGGDSQDNGLITLFVCSPFLAEPTLLKSEIARNQTSFATPGVDLYYGNHSTATSYDGFSLIMAAGNVTGNYTVYGLRK
jgi:hypothetical protein